MIRKACGMVLLLFCLSVLSGGCGKKINPAAPAQTVVNQAVKTQQPLRDVEIKVWVYSGGWEDPVKKFESLNPGVKVNIQTFDYAASNESYTKALASGNGPDVLAIDSGFFGQYTVNGVLQDLLQPPFLAGKYEKDFSRSSWESNMSVDGRKLLALTFLTSPYVTFYREDIMRENGFPSDPEELGKYMEKAENLMAIANKLKRKDQYIFQWPTDIPDLMGASTGIFDRQLGFVRDTDLFVKGLDIAKEAHRLGLEAQVSIWNEDGKQAIKKGQLVMVLNLGSWGTSTIQNYAPEQMGKWRITNPVLCINAWSSSTKLAINAQSQNKEWAWKFIEFIATHQDKGEDVDMVPGYISARKNPKNMSRKSEFLGGQITYPLYEQLVENMREYKMTPLDDKAIEVFRKEVSDIVSKNIDSSSAVNSIAKKVEDAVSEEQEALLSSK